MRTVRFGFLSWDWKGSMSIGELNTCLRHIHQPRVTSLGDETGDDSFQAVVHSRRQDLRRSQWAHIYSIYMDELADDDPLYEFREKMNVVESHVWEMSEQDFEALVAAIDELARATARSSPITNPIIAKRHKNETFVVTEELLNKRRH